MKQLCNNKIPLRQRKALKKGRGGEDACLALFQNHPQNRVHADVHTPCAKCYTYALKYALESWNFDHLLSF